MPEQADRTPVGEIAEVDVELPTNQNRDNRTLFSKLKQKNEGEERKRRTSGDSHWLALPSFQCILVGQLCPMGSLCGIFGC
jgi:hypothetical protein